jgi:hypothetical protein
MNRHKMYFVALFTFGPPVYSWKYRSSGTLKLIGPPEKQKMASVTHPTQLMPEDVDLIQEQDDRCPEEPPRVYYRVEKDERFGHPVLKSAPAVRTTTRKNIRAQPTWSFASIKT